MLAEQGQSYIKHYRNSNQSFIKNLKMNQNVDMVNLKSFKGHGSNVQDDKDINEIMIMYYKARYSYTTAFIERCTKILNGVINIIKMQCNFAIQNYIQYISAIKRYVKIEA
jgi:hypothetical protein